MPATGDRRMFIMKQADGHKWQLKGNWIRVGTLTTLTSSGEFVWLYGVAHQANRLTVSRAIKCRNRACEQLRHNET